MTRQEAIDRLLAINSEYKDKLTEKGVVAKQIAETELLINQKKAEKLATRSSLTVKGKEAMAFNDSIPEIMEFNKLKADEFYINIHLEKLNKEVEILSKIIEYLK